MSDMINKKKFIHILKKSSRGILYMFPIIIGILGLSSLLINYLNPEDVKQLFTGDRLWDTLSATIVGSLMLGNAFVSYILGGELIDAGVSMYAITAFLLAWVSIGYVQIPLEVSYFGKKFVLLRSLLAMIFTVILSVLIVLTYETI
jgi:uncharacterized membrane protein YraQ (UPF0718 family)